MKKILLLSLLCILTCSGAFAQEETIQLSLKDAIRMAVERNLDVKAELFNSASSEADIHKFRGIYDPLLSLLANFQDSNTLSVSTVASGGSSVFRQQTVRLNPSASQLLPTGGSVSLAFDNS